MSTQDIEKQRVSLDFSSNDVTSMLDYDLLQDFASKVIAHHSNANVDKRTVAVGDIPELFHHDFIYQANDDFRDYLATIALNSLFLVDLFRGTPDNPSQVLTYWADPGTEKLNDLIDGGTHYTFINESFLYNIEEFYLNDPSIASKGPFSYSAINRSDILAGEKTDFFDAAYFTARQLVDLNFKFIDAVMDSIKVGGWIVVKDAAGLGSLYRDSMKIHKNYFGDLNRKIRDRSDFRTYHFPMHLGLTFAKKIG